LPLHDEDIAVLISELEDSSSRVLLFRLVPSAKAIDVFENLDPEYQKEVLSGLSQESMRQILNEMAPDERTELFEEMPASLVKRLLNILSSQERKIAIELLGYPEESVGRLITPEFVQLYEDMMVQDALAHIRRVGVASETVYHCYVLDKQKKLIGVVSLRKIVLADLSARIDSIMSSDVIKVNVYTDREEAALIFKKYDLLALPVTDNNDRLLGIVTFDDFVDVLEDEATEDFEKIAAVVPVDKPYMEAGFFELLWKRSFWLIILLVLESLSGLVMEHYSGTIKDLITLVFFVPILIAAGGNSGTQSATFIIRGLSTGDIHFSDFWRVIIKEARLGIFIGIILAVFGIARAYFQVGNWWLSVTVGISIALAIIMANLVGASLPLVLRRLKLDPALMSGPLITTIVDVAGIALYFEVARHLLPLG